MSWEATAYVKSLKRCEDGEPLSRGQKLLLFVLADCHNPHKRVSFPSVPLLAEDALTSLAQVKRDLAYLELHCVIRKQRPEKSGRGHNLEYVFLSIDDQIGLRTALAKLAKGAHGEPLLFDKGAHDSTPFCPEERGSEGAHGERERGSEGAHGERRNKEEPLNQLRTSEPRGKAAPRVRPFEPGTENLSPQAYARSPGHAVAAAARANGMRDAYFAAEIAPNRWRLSGNANGSHGRIVTASGELVESSNEQQQTENRTA